MTQYQAASSVDVTSHQDGTHNPGRFTGCAKGYRSPHAAMLLLSSEAQTDVHTDQEAKSMPVRSLIQRCRRQAVGVLTFRQGA